MGKCSYIDGIASSQVLDTAGEIVDLRGLDISSLVGAAFNWEHLKDQPSQIVGKILKAHKIFSVEDCQDERQLKYWEKCQVPFLYVMGRLFDDKKPSSVEVAALFKDDAEHPSESDMVAFSVEGAKIAKEGATIIRSIARKVTITHIPANKSCIAEMIPESKEKKGSSLDSLFKGEVSLFEFESSYVELLKKEELEKDYGGGSGAFIGDTMAMSEEEHAELAKAGWSNPTMTNNRISYKHSQHGNVSVSKTKVGNFEVHHNDKLVGVSPNIKHAGQHAGKYMSTVAKGETVLSKALEAGSGMAAPSELVQGAALASESLEKPKKMAKKERSDSYKQADQAYQTWDKREKFRQYMQKRLPHLAEGEVDAIGRVLAFKKHVQAEKKLSSMYLKQRDSDK